MSIHHHPRDETLMGYAAGALAAAPSIVVAAHLESCPACRARVRDFEALGGALLDNAPPVTLAPAALADTLGRMESGAGERPQDAPPPGPESPGSAPEIDGVRLPGALRGCAIGRWRWIGPGMRMSRVGVPALPGANLILLKVGPGGKLPMHTHAGAELTHVVSGAYRDALGRFGPGDFADLDETAEHQPTVEPDAACVCLVAVEGRLRFRGAVPRLLQPLFGV